jgi:hypothetical protein
MSRIARLSLITGVLGTLALLPHQSVSAAPPTHQFDLDLSFTSVLPPAFTGCSFDLTVTNSGTSTVTTYYDQMGNVTKVHVTSPPSGLSVIFSANGHTYTSVSPGNQWTFYVNGNPTQITVNGLEVHLKIPGMGVVGQAVGHFTIDLTTGTVTQNGQWTLSPLGNWSPEVCALFAP